MKKRTIIIILSLCLGIGIFFKIQNIKMSNEPKLNVKIPKDSITLKEEDYGGFFGDGEYFIEIQLSDEGYLQFLSDAEKTGKWESLPMSPKMEAFIIGGEYNNMGYWGCFSKYHPNKIENGFYYFRNRFEGDYSENKDFIDRYVYNFTLAIVDAETKRLYIYELDT